MLNSKKEVFLNFLQRKNLLITTHDLADLDGFISGIALKYCFETYFPNQNIQLTFSGLSKHTKSFINKFSTKFPNFNFNYQEHVELSDIDVIVVADSNNLDHVKLFNNIDLDIPFIFIDHHLNLQKNYPGNVLSLNLIFDRDGVRII
ncbi:MAG: DHH family phosphoesterase [Promethearchaeota archaeon]